MISSGVQKIKKNWGVLILVLLSSTAYVQFLRAKTAIHYLVFSGPGPFFWRGENPYPMLFVSGNDEQRYLYSPAFSMFFFHPFSFLPEVWGRFAYLTLSLVIFVAGFLYWVKHVEKLHGFRMADHPWKNWIAIVLGSELVGAIFYCKIELLELGVFFALLVPLMQGRVALPFFLLGLMAEIKFQTVPVIGLALIAVLFLRDRFIPALLSATAGFLVGELAVMAVVTPTTWLVLTRSRFENMAYIVNNYWKGHYQHIFKTFLAAGVPLELSHVRLIAGTLSLIFATGLYLHLSYWRERLSLNETRSVGYLAAIAFGLSFMLLFSPMSQSNAYTLTLPLFMLLVVLNPEGKSKGTLGLIILSYFLISGVYSDLVPVSWRQFARHWGAKPWGFIPLFFAVIKDTYLKQPSAATQKAWPLACTGP